MAFPLVDAGGEREGLDSRGGVKWEEEIVHAEARRRGEVALAVGAGAAATAGDLDAS